MAKQPVECSSRNQFVCSILFSRPPRGEGVRKQPTAAHAHASYVENDNYNQDNEEINLDQIETDAQDQFQAAMDRADFMRYGQPEVEVEQQQEDFDEVCQWKPHM